MPFERSRTQRVGDSPRARGTYSALHIPGAPAINAMGTGRTAACRPDGAGPMGLCKPRRPQASPLFRLVADQFRTLQLVYDERFAPTYGAWRAVVPEVADKFLACGVLEHGCARVRCDACAHEYLLAFSCKARYFCPSCHAKRLALWTLWLEETLLAAVPHRQVVLTIPTRPYTGAIEIPIADIVQGRIAIEFRMGSLAEAPLR